MQFQKLMKITTGSLFRNRLSGCHAPRGALCDIPKDGCEGSSERVLGLKTPYRL